MSLSQWCLLAAALLPIVCAGIAKSGRFSVPRREGGYDNALPRAWLAQQEGWRARANAAQANSFEALPFFVGALLWAQMAGAVQARIDALAAAFVLLRVAYIALYIGDRPNGRSVVWALAWLCCVALLFAANW